jgi:hypothetical protein
MQVDEPKPSWRKPFGAFLILLLIALWAVLVAMGADLMGGLPWPVFVVYFGVAGFVWILPLKPLLRWIETGSFRAS